MLQCVYFEAAHHLPNLPKEHKCHRLHGHFFRVLVYLEGPVGAASSWVEDFAEIKKAFELLYAQLDHRYLKELEGLDNPTSDNKGRAQLPWLTTLTPRASNAVA